MKNNKLFLDIETLPPQGGDHLARIKSTVKAPGQYKKPESIAQWLAENADSFALEEFGKLGLDGLYGEVCCIGYAMNTSPVVVVARDPRTEPEAIAFAFDAMQEASVDQSGSWRSFTVVGHNIEFDLRFLMQRAVRFGITIPPCLREAFDPERGRYNTFDTMKAWAGFKGWAKLKDMSRELFADDGADIDGSEVAAAWAKDPAAVVEHCRADVNRTRRLFNAMAITLWGEAA